jgi:hypothetical protein
MQFRKMCDVYQGYNLGAVPTLHGKSQMKSIG